MDLSNTDKQEKREHFEKLNAAFYQKQKKGCVCFVIVKVNQLGHTQFQKIIISKKLLIMERLIHLVRKGRDALRN